MYALFRGAFRFCELCVYVCGNRYPLPLVLKRHLCMNTIYPSPYFVLRYSCSYYLLTALLKYMQNICIVSRHQWTLHMHSNNRVFFFLPWWHQFFPSARRQSKCFDSLPACLPRPADDVLCVYKWKTFFCFLLGPTIYFHDSMIDKPIYIQHLFVKIIRKTYINVDCYSYTCIHACDEWEKSDSCI